VFLRLPQLAWRAVAWAAAIIAALFAARCLPYASAAERPPESAAPFALRALYAPGHFGNSYEAMGVREMHAMLEEAAWWGFNRYGDWFDMEDCSDPFAETRLVQLAHALWQRKKDHFRSAQSLGMACDLIITPNHVYVDQCQPHLLAQKDARIFGQLICPSKTEARTIILRNYENLFRDLAASGVRLSAICPCPYDFGGCACDQCRPWIVTYARLCEEIHQLAVEQHPGVAMHMIGWWWSAEEHQQLAAWADRQTPGRITSMYLHIPYGKTEVADVALPTDCQRGAFVHIGYADQASPRDVYGHFGPVIAAERLPATLQTLQKQGAAGVMAYSEGVFDDVNKAILAGLGSGKFASADDVMTAYVERYFGVPRESAGPWVAWLKSWGRPFEVDLAASRAALATLPRGSRADEWRTRQWELKLDLFAQHARIMSESTWTAERRAAVDEFWSVQEKIHRGLWGLPPQRHIFDRRFTPTPWYAEWAKLAAEQAKTAGPEQ
jgi:hypothetical protein